MTWKELLTERIKELEKEQVTLNKKLDKTTDNIKKMQFIIEMESIKKAIFELYVCIGKGDMVK